MKRPDRQRNQEVMLAGVLLMQICLGILNVLLLAPVWLQLVHLLVAELFWILVVLAAANLAFVPLTPISAMAPMLLLDVDDDLGDGRSPALVKRNFRDPGSAS